ncbi:spore yyac: putative sporulation protein yyac [Lucifera butyrica]|uniref:Spore yyac: putative sporulation protein yyac n=1 Tax=Lucifera butyrica TaxID=1351585 RepID=A0A498RBJ1_9FIRM|nr:spore protease YyaC [Lucifera butyrica]VBB07503.1 spore yyac: putative sporulation protein yyac [Lucifera butyrica]
MLTNLFDFTKSAKEIKFSIHQPNTTYEMAMNIRCMIQEAAALNQEVIVLCIGTDRSTGDSLGPLTGTKLKSINLYPHIFGTLDDPVHATNLPNMLTFIHSSFANPFIIAVDACLGKLENVGFVSLGHGSLKPGAAVNKNLPAVGDVYITGIVNVSGFMEHLVLQSTRLNLVMRMSETIAHSLSFALSKIAK